jgi:cytochrome c-type biogenesis protein CcmH
MRARLLTLIAVAAVISPALAADAIAATPAPRASFTDVENDVMCVSCREPLAVAQSPQAYAERAYIHALIAQGLTKPQIEQQLVAQYGPAVLGKPRAQGFNLTVYILPPAILVGGVIILAVVLPRWRRRTRAEAAEAAPAVTAAALHPGEARRLEDELSHWSG